MLVEGCWLLRVGQGKSLGPYPAGIGSLVIIVRQAFAFGTRFKCPVIASPPRTRSFNLWVAASALANKLQYCFAPTFNLSSPCIFAGNAYLMSDEHGPH